MSGVHFDRCVLTTQRMQLRPFQISDADRVMRLLGDYEVSKFLARVPYPYTAEKMQAWLTRLLDPNWVEQADFALDLGDGAVGGVGLREVDGRAQIGYWLARSHWGQGLMSEGASAALSWLLDTTDHDEVDSGAFEGNLASLRIQQKLGFEITGQHNAHCLAQGVDLPHIDTLLKRNRFRPLAK